jgi:thioesterase domain-containing protein
MAHALRARGRDVEALLLLDPFVPAQGGAAPPDPALDARLGVLWETLRGLGITPAASQLAAARSRPPAAQEALLRAAVLAHGGTVPDLAAPAVRVRAALTEAAQGWRPRPYAGRARLLITREYAGAPAWRSWLRGPCRVGTTPGDHFSMLAPPHVATLADLIRAGLRWAASRRGRKPA